MAAFADVLLFTEDDDRGSGAQWVTVSSWGELLQNEGKYSVYWETKEVEVAKEQQYDVDRDLFKADDDEIEEEEVTEKNAGDDEDVDYSGVDTSCYGNAVSLLRKTNSGESQRIERRIGGSRSQFKLLLLVSREDANRMAITPYDETHFRFDIDPSIDDAAPEESIYESGVISMVKSIRGIYPSVKNLFWSSFGIIKRRQESQRLDDCIINVKYRVKIGVKLISRRTRIPQTPFTSAIDICNEISQTGQGGMTFQDAIPKAEYDMINFKLARHLRKESVVYIVHFDYKKEACRVTCERDDVSGRLAAVKVKLNTQKYTIIDIVRPSRCDVRFDVRTTDGLAKTSKLYSVCEEIVGSLGYEVESGFFVAEKIEVDGFVKLGVIRRKSKKQFYVPGATGPEGMTKVSTATVTQYDIQLPPRQLPSFTGPLPTTTHTRYEAAAQLLSTKRHLDSLKNPDTFINPNLLLTLSEYMLPNTLCALQQIPASEALALGVAVKPPQQYTPKEPANDAEMSSDDEV